MIAGTKRIVPIGSNCKMWRLNPTDGRGSRAGTLKETRLTAATTAPTVQNECQGHTFRLETSHHELENKTSKSYLGYVIKRGLHSQGRLI